MDRINVPATGMINNAAARRVSQLSNSDAACRAGFVNCPMLQNLAALCSVNLLLLRSHSSFAIAENRIIGSHG